MTLFSLRIRGRPHALDYIFGIQTLIEQTIARLRAKRVPTHLQYQTTECGVAALAMILAYHGRHVPMEEIRRVTGVSRDCLNAADMVRAGRHYGLQCAAYSREPDDLRCMEFPFVAHLRFIHFVVVEGMTTDKVLVNDPACGQSEIPIEQFNETFTGIIITFRPGPDFVPSGHPDRLYADLWRRIDGKSRTLIGGAGVAACLIPMTLVALAHALGDAFTGFTQGAAISIAAAVLLCAALSMIQATALNRARTRMSARMTGAFLETLMRRPFAYLSYRLPSEQVKSVYDIDLIARLLYRALLPALLTLPSVAILLFALYRLDAAAGAVVGAIVALTGLALTATANWRAGNGRKARSQADEELRSIFGQLATIENDKIAGMDRDFVAGGMGKQADAAIHDQRDGAAHIAANILTHVSALGSVFGAALTAGYAFNKGTLSASGLISTIVLACALTHVMRHWPQLRGKLSALHLALLRQDDLETADAGGHETPDAPASLNAPALRFQGVVFGHSPTRAPLLNGVDFAFQTDAEQVGITGRSGGGKSTFAALAAGLHAPWSGVVEAGPHVMWVDKSQFLFDGTVRDNLMFWREGVDDGDLWRALRDACVDDVISSRPKGLGTAVIARGRNFSGGQRQRLEIARALTYDPKVLILDEALDALNPALEEKLRVNLRRRGCALVIVSHRASTLAACDRVLHFADRRLHEQCPASEAATTMVMRQQIERVFTTLDGEHRRPVSAAVDQATRSEYYARQVRFVQSAFWRQPHLPLIGHRRGEADPVSLHPAPGGYRINGEDRTASLSEVEPIAVCVYPPGATEIRTPHALAQLWTASARTDLVRAIGITVLVTVAVLLLARLPSYVLATGAADSVLKIWLSFVGGLIIVALLGSAQRISMLRAEHYIRIAAMGDLFQRLIRIRSEFFRTEEPERLARAISVIGRALDWLRRNSVTVTADLVMILGGCLVLGWRDPRLGLIAALLSLVVAIGWPIIASAVRAMQRAADDHRLAGRHFLFDMMLGMARLRVVGAAGRATAHWQELHWRNLEADSRLAMVDIWCRSAAELWLWTSLTLLTAGAVTWGTATPQAAPIVAIMVSAWLVLTAALRIGDAFADSRRVSASLPELRRLLQAPLEPDGVKPGPASGIELESVSYAYPGTAIQALQEISLCIVPGEIVALVGPSGSGKSTLLRLLLGFEQPTHGRVLVGGRNVEGVDVRTWRNGIGVVQQDDRIESSSTMRSLISSLADVNIDDVWQAADLAQLGDDIRDMPMGMQTIVEHGKLSTGQEQRLLIARQLLRRPSLLILDEATNAISEEMQARIFANLRMAGIGCILATHRDNAIAAADRVIVLDAGRFLWDGSPAVFAGNKDFNNLLQRERLVEGDA